MCYTDYYGQIKGTTLCADHSRVLDLFDPLYIAAYSTDHQKENQAVLDSLLRAQMQVLVSEARNNGDQHLIPNKDYGLFSVSFARNKIGFNESLLSQTRTHEGASDLYAATYARKNIGLVHVTTDNNHQETFTAICSNGTIAHFDALEDARRKLVTEFQDAEEIKLQTAEIAELQQRIEDTDSTHDLMNIQRQAQYIIWSPMNAEIKQAALDIREVANQKIRKINRDSK